MFAGCNMMLKRVDCENAQSWPRLLCASEKVTYRLVLGWIDSAHNNSLARHRHVAERLREKIPGPEDAASCLLPFLMLFRLGRPYAPPATIAKRPNEQLKHMGGIWTPMTLTTASKKWSSVVVVCFFI